MSVLSLVICFCLFGTFGGIKMASTMSSTTDFFPNAADNLTQITWAHAVNDGAYLDDVLKSDIMMIEADIVMGTLDGDTSDQRIPIMGHPPADKSDLSLEQFLSRVSEHNDISGTVRKGVKLDFKSIEVFEESLPILSMVYEKATFPIWINADILPGPVESQVLPVDADRFLMAAAKYQSSTLSIGWTTLYGGDITYGVYSEQQIDDMLSTIQKQEVANEVTFPMRAGIAANSLNQIIRLLTETMHLNSTLTIWSSDGDFVDIALLKQLILEVGLSKVYLDVPKDVSDVLNL